MKKFSVVFAAAVFLAGAPFLSSPSRAGESFDKLVTLNFKGVFYLSAPTEPWPDLDSFYEMPFTILVTLADGPHQCSGVAAVAPRHTGDFGCPISGMVDVRQANGKKDYTATVTIPDGYVFYGTDSPSRTHTFQIWSPYNTVSFPSYNIVARH